MVAALAASFIAFMSMLGPANAVPMQFLAGRAAAAGIAAMNTITMFAGFVGPYWMGVMKDHTGSYDGGIERTGAALPACGGNHVCVDAKPGAAARCTRGGTGERSGVRARRSAAAR